MFRQLVFIITPLVLLAACGGNNTATPASAVQQVAPTTNPDATPSQVVPTNGPREYSEGTQEVQLPLTGTIVPPATEDPLAGQPFDLITLDRMGGVSGKELIVTLAKDGTVTRDGVKSSIPADLVKEIGDKLDQMGFFGMKGIFQAPGTSADVFTYYLTVNRQGSERQITAQDGYTPPELTDLLQTISKLGATK